MDHKQKNQMKSQCYLHGYPSDCQYQLQDLYNLIRDDEDSITLERIFKMLRTWQYEVPFSNLCLLLRKANQACHQNAKNYLNEVAFHQLLHNPDIQKLFKPKNDEIYSTPPTIEGLFKRMGEQIERKRLHEKLKREGISNKEKFNFMLQLLQVGSPRKEKECSITMEKTKSVRKVIDDDFNFIKQQKKSKRKAESMQDPQNPPKFTKLPNTIFHAPTSPNGGCTIGSQCQEVEQYYSQIIGQPFNKVTLNLKYMKQQRYQMDFNLSKSNLLQKIQPNREQSAKKLSNSEVNAAIQKYFQMLKKKEGKSPSPIISQTQSSKILSQLVTKVSPSLDINVPIKPPTPSGTQSYRPLSEKKPHHRPQQSVGQSKDLILQKLQTALFQKPKTQSQQVTPKSGGKGSASVNKYFESTKKQQGEFHEYYLSKVKVAFSKPLKDDYFSRMYREHFFQTYQGICVASYLQPVDPNDLQNKKVKLKQKECYKNKITIVFDLDETLVHCNESLVIPSDLILSIQVSPQETIKAGINIRPGAVKLLELLVNDFELVIFTASHPCYAQKVIEHLDPQKTLFSHSLYRDNCIMTTGGMYTKDLRIFDRPLSQLVLVDNASYSYAWQLDNGIPIVPFYDNKEDRELESLLKYLKGMQGCKDVREYNRNNLRLQYFQDPSGAGMVFEKLFQQKMEI
ncbi:unnamed protein product [Paramecium pentaurelia]|uniref:FCP1 homology domain-containing protein n=1 Tax=Paramecium pentaurelia TaxID=43138 RepID=A0A8S1UKJ1_9CILI|nr:unnamed protein product [Paramecium pentaurelia]